MDKISCNLVFILSHTSEARFYMRSSVCQFIIDNLNKNLLSLNKILFALWLWQVLAWVKYSKNYDLFLSRTLSVCFITLTKKKSFYRFQSNFVCSLLLTALAYVPHHFWTSFLGIRSLYTTLIVVSFLLMCVREKFSARK